MLSARYSTTQRFAFLTPVLSARTLLRQSGTFLHTSTVGVSLLSNLPPSKNRPSAVHLSCFWSTFLVLCCSLFEHCEKNARNDQFWGTVWSTNACPVHLQLLAYFSSPNKLHRNIWVAFVLVWVASKNL